MKKIVLNFLIALIIFSGVFLYSSSGLAVVVCDPETEQLVNGACVPKQTGTSAPYQLLVPLPSPDGELRQIPVSDANSFGMYLNTMIKIFIGICAVLAMVMIIAGGLEYMTSELISSKEAGKSRMLNAIGGLVLALGAWTILNTINPDLLKTDVTIEEARIEVTIENIDDSAPQEPVNGRLEGRDVGSPWNAATAGHSETLPLPAGVTWKQPACTTVGQRGCTSLFGLGLVYVNRIKTGCSECLPLTITGGTEYWLHGKVSGKTSHRPSNNTVDLRRTSALDKYVAGDKPLVMYGRYEKDGMSFLFEGNHWHVGR